MYDNKRFIEICRQKLSDFHIDTRNLFTVGIFERSKFKVGCDYKLVFRAGRRGFNRIVAESRKVNALCRVFFKNTLDFRLFIFEEFVYGIFQFGIAFLYCKSILFTG